MNRIITDDLQLVSAQTVTYTSAGVAIFSSVNWSAIGVMLGITISACSLALQFWIAIRNDRRAQAAHHLTMLNLLEKGKKVDDDNNRS